MKTILEGLLSYFAQNSKGQIMKDWDEFKFYDNIGPKIDIFIDHLSQQKFDNSFLKTSNLNNLKKDPKYSSDFFYTFV